MDYSLTFTMGGVTKNTWDDWGMIPNTPPMVNPPELNTRYVDIPGRTNGPIDLTAVPFNRNTYKRMTGSWTFYREPDNRYTRKELFEILRAYFTGNVGKVVLSEDTNHYFVGRFTVGVPKTGNTPIEFTINYDLEPTRYNSNDSVDSTYAAASGTGYIGGGGGSGSGSSSGNTLTIEYNDGTQDLRVIGF